MNFFYSISIYPCTAQIYLNEVQIEHTILNKISIMGENFLFDKNNNEFKDIKKHFNNKFQLSYTLLI